MSDAEKDKKKKSKEAPADAEQADHGDGSRKKDKKDKKKKHHDEDSAKQQSSEVPASDDKSEKKKKHTEEGEAKASEHKKDKKDKKEKRGDKAADAAQPADPEPEKKERKHKSKKHDDEPAKEPEPEQEVPAPAPEEPKKEKKDKKKKHDDEEVEKPAEPEEVKKDKKDKKKKREEEPAPGVEEPVAEELPKEKKDKKDKKKSKSEKQPEPEPEPDSAPAAEETEHKKDKKGKKKDKMAVEEEKPKEDSEEEGELELIIDDEPFEKPKTAEEEKEELLAEGWVIAPTGHMIPKQKPERPLPRAPGQGVNKEAEVTWAAKPTINLEEFGISAEGEQPVEIQEEVEPPITFEGPVLEKYDIGGEVARLGATRVHGAKDKASGKEYLLRFQSKQVAPVHTEESAAKLVETMKAASGAPHAEELVDSFLDKDAAYLIIEKTESDLPTFIKNTAASSWTEKHVALVIKQLVEFVAGLQEKRVLHRDINPFSLFVKSVDGTNPAIVVSNFAQATIIDPADPPKDEPAGNELFKSPELAGGEVHSFPVDMWSVGCTAYYLLCGRAPFAGEKNRLRRRMSIKSAVFKFVDSEFGKISDHARDFINKLLRAKPGDRLTATDALAHPFLAAPSGDTVLELVAEQITL